MKKIIIGLIIVIVLAALAAAIVSHLKSSGAADQPGSGAGSTATSNGSSTNSDSSAIVKIYQMPTSTTITLGTPHGSVMMKNFYLASAGAEDQFIILATSSNYEITYDPDTNEFYIYVAAAPYAANRAQAESDFLARLGIGNTDACKLNVGEALGGQKAGGLSFCSPSGVIQ